MTYYTKNTVKHNLERFSSELNQQKIKISNHAGDNLVYLFGAEDIYNLVQDIKRLKFKKKDVYKYETGNDIERVCYNIYFRNKDTFFVLSKDKVLITIYRRRR